MIPKNEKGKYSINTEPEYLEALVRISNGLVFLEGKWFNKDPETKKFIDEYNNLSEALLAYQIENNLIDLSKEDVVTTSSKP